MKRNILKTIMLGSTLLIGVQTMAQNKNVVSAAIEYKNYRPALMKGDFDEAKKVLLESKGLIDKAMNHEDTKNDEKANYYNAIINYSLVELSSVGKVDGLEVYQNDSIIDVIKGSIIKASEKRRYRLNIKDFVNRKVSQAVMIGQSSFESKNYKTAFAGFAGAYMLKDMADIEEERDAMKQNAIIAGSRYIDTLKKQEKTEEAYTFIEGALESFPESAELAISGVNIALKDNSLEKAEQFFNSAAKADPENKELFSSMGSIYLTAAKKSYKEFTEMDITDDGYQDKSDEMEELYSKAEKHLKRALEIDPDYAGASYNLGVLYLGRAGKLKSTAGKMKLNNPDFESTKKRSDKFYKKAIDPLEDYIKTDPNNAGVLQVLFEVHGNAGNIDKAMEYRKRAKEAAAKQQEGGEEEE